MVFVGKISLVCATAISTLIAGFPHLECKCANGRFKPFCLSIFVENSSCCCDGACCCASNESTDSSNAKPHSCCCRGKPSSDKSNSFHGGNNAGKEKSSPLAEKQIQKSGCSKKAAQGKHFLVGQGDVLKEGITVSLFLTAAPSCLVVARPIASGRFFGQIHTVDPPTNLITLLGHLRI